ncbi:S8 family serine peptidase [Nanoarchaeota archaeon]
MNKKGQIILFVIIALILILGAVVFVILNGSTEKDTVSNSDQVVEFNSKVSSFKAYITSCIKGLTREAFTQLGPNNGLLTQYLKLNAVECFDTSLFTDIEVNIGLPLKVRVLDRNDDYKVEIELDTQFSQSNLDQRVREYNFIIPKSYLTGAAGIEADINLDGEDFSLVAENKSLVKEFFIEEEVIVHYNTAPDNVVEFETLLNSLFVLEREPIYDEMLLNIDDFDEEFKDIIESIQLDEKLVFDSNKISFNEIKTQLLNLDFIDDVTLNSKSYSGMAVFYVKIDDMKKRSQPKYSSSSTDSFSRHQWYLNNEGQFFGIPDKDINIAEAWDITEGSEDIIISVIDQGVFPNPDISNNILFGSSYNFVHRNNNVYPTSYYETHGSHVSGLIVSEKDNNFGISGICPNCKVINMRIMDAYGGADSRTLINAVLLSVSRGAKVVSMSLGGTYYSAYEEYVFSKLAEKGIIFIAAAGNDGINQKNYPAAYNGVISVAATDNIDDLAYFSNFGNWVDIAAPGELILSICGVRRYCFQSGTSMATPIVSGVVGLMLSVNPDLTPNQVESLLKQNSDSIGENFGRINAGRVVEVMS